VTYEFELLEGCKIHNIFHVLCLKKALEQHVVTSIELWPLEGGGELILVVEKILETRERKLWNRTIKGNLVKWKDLPVEDATWEGEQVLKHPKLKFLEGKQFWAGRIAMSPTT